MACEFPFELPLPLRLDPRHLLCESVELAVLLPRARTFVIVF